MFCTMIAFVANASPFCVMASVA